MTKTLRAVIIFILSVCIIYLSQDIGIFWDNVLFVSKIGTYFYENGFSNYIPDIIDPGHPPFIGIYMSLVWNLFGRSLSISHWSMLPWVFGVLWQLQSFIRFFIEREKWVWLGFILILCDPTFSAQLVQVNAELFLLFFLLMSLNGLLRKNRWQQFIGLALLGIMSKRGMLLCGGIFIIDFIFLWKSNKAFKSRISSSHLTYYLMAAIPALSFLLFHYQVKDWIFQNPSNEWGDKIPYRTTYEYVKALGKEILVIGFRYLDFGRIFIFTFLAAIFLKNKAFRQDKSSQKLLIISIASVIFILLTTLIIKNSTGHRYIIISIVSLELLALYYIAKYSTQKWIYIAFCVGLISGNLWIYPPQISQGWDSTLAHLPYWKLRDKAIQYLDDNGIDIQKTASFFPNETTLDYVDLNGDARAFKSFDNTNNYVLYSNIYNLSDEALWQLKKNYSTIQKWEKSGIVIILYEKKVSEH